MKMAMLSLHSCAALLVALAAQAQGTFQNLDFESASLVPIPGDPYGSVQFDPAFPGWAGYVGGVQLTRALYNNYFLDSSGISIIDQGSSFGDLIEGNFTAILQAGVALGTFTPADTMLAQTGRVPLGTKSLLFKANARFGPSGAFSVALGGQTLTLTSLSTGANYTLYGADIHSFAGQIEQLSYTVFADRPHQIDEYLSLDSIQFSNVAIPEPSAACLSALGVALVFRRFARASGGWKK